MGNFIKTSLLIHIVTLAYEITSFILFSKEISTLIVPPILVVITHVIATIFMFVLSKKDPGIIRKQIPKFEYDRETSIIPVDVRALY